MHILYCQKMIFPNCSAHSIHTGVTLANFAAAGGKVEFFPGCARNGCGRTVKEHFRSLGFEDTPGVTLNEIPFTHKGLYGLGFRWKLWRAMRGCEMAVCYATSVAEAHMALQLRRYAGKSGVRPPVVFEMHHMISLLKAGRKAARLRAVEESVFREADMVVFISEALRQQAERLLPPPKFSLVSHLGYNEKAIRPAREAAADEPQIGNGFTTLVYLGSLQPGKGVEELIQAMSLVPENYRLTIVGGRPEKCFVKMRELAAACAVDGKVNFTGQIPPSELSDRLKECDIFVIPVQTEADFFCPMKMYEALGFNLPVVATPNASLKEVLVDGVNAVFATGNIAPELAAAIVRLGRNPGLRRSMRRENASLSAGYSSIERARKLLAAMRDRFSTGSGVKDR